MSTPTEDLSDTYYLLVDMTGPISGWCTQSHPQNTSSDVHSTDAPTSSTRLFSDHDAFDECVATATYPLPQHIPGRASYVRAISMKQHPLPPSQPRKERRKPPRRKSRGWLCSGEEEDERPAMAHYRNRGQTLEEAMCGVDVNDVVNGVVDCGIEVVEQNDMSHVERAKSEQRCVSVVSRTSSTCVNTGRDGAGGNNSAGITAANATRYRHQNQAATIRNGPPESAQTRFKTPFENNTKIEKIRDAEYRTAPAQLWKIPETQPHRPSNSKRPLVRQFQRPSNIPNIASKPSILPAIYQQPTYSISIPDNQIQTRVRDFIKTTIFKEQPQNQEEEDSSASIMHQYATVLNYATQDPLSWSLPVQTFPPLVSLSSKIQPTHTTSTPPTKRPSMKGRKISMQEDPLLSPFRSKSNDMNIVNKQASNNEANDFGLEVSGLSIQ